MKSRDGKSKRREGEKKRREEKKKEDPKKRQSEERRCRCGECGKEESRDSLCFSNGLWLRSAKAAGAEPSGQMRDEKLHALWREAHFQVKRSEHFGSWDVEKCTPLWREAHFQVEMYKILQCWSTFGSWHVEKVHAVVAQSTFRSQKC